MRSVMLAFLALSCWGGRGVDSGSGDPAGDGFDPLPGTYLFAQASMGLDWCGVGDESTYTFTADVSFDEAAGRMTVTNGDWTHGCAWDDPEFLCLFDEGSAAVEDREALLAWTEELGGAWLRADEVAAEHVYTLDCTGADCDAVAGENGVAYPCTTTRDMVGTLLP